MFKVKEHEIIDSVEERMKEKVGVDQLKRLLKESGISEERLRQFKQSIHASEEACADALNYVNKMRGEIIKCENMNEINKNEIVRLEK